MNCVKKTVNGKDQSRINLNIFLGQAATIHDGLDMGNSSDNEGSGHNSVSNIYVHGKTKRHSKSSLEVRIILCVCKIFTSGFQK